MKIDRARAQKAFADYAAHYNAADAKVKLKIDHTYRVAALCARIAQSLALPPEDVDLAWLSGILHDVGRFEQLRRYNTFIDAQSVSHAALSVAALRRSPVTPAVLDAFYAHHCVLHSLKQYPADNAVGHASLVFELCYPESLRIVDEQGWLWRLLDFKTDNPDTAAAFAAIRDELHRWLHAQSA